MIQKKKMKCATWMFSRNILVVLKHFVLKYVVTLMLPYFHACPRKLNIQRFYNTSRMRYFHFVLHRFGRRQIDQWINLYAGARLGRARLVISCTLVPACIAVLRLSNVNFSPTLSVILDIDVWLGNKWRSVLDN